MRGRCVIHTEEDITADISGFRYSKTAICLQAAGGRGGRVCSVIGDDAAGKGRQ